jgi:hypothetical protein
MGMALSTMDRIRMREMRADGMTCSQIAKIMGRCIATVHKHVVDVKCKVRPKWTSLTTTEIREMRRLRALGRTFTECGAAVGRSQSVAFVQAHDVYLPKRTKAVNTRRRRAERIEALFSSCNRAVAEARV